MHCFMTSLFLYVTCVCLWTTVCANLSPVDGVFSWSRDDSSLCNFPPDLWCSSVSIAKKCKVERQCSHNVWQRPAQSVSKVSVTLYFESLCPDSQFFFSDQLIHAYPALSSILNLELVPYGNAQETQDGSTWLFDCQHGPAECLGNIIETCVLSLYKDLNASFPFISCMEASGETPSESAPKCAKAHGIDMSAVQKCVGSPAGNALEHQMAVKTDALNPPHQYVPWITLNGEHTDDIQAKAEQDLVKLICDTYQGTDKPPACTKYALKAVAGHCLQIRPLL